MKIEFLTQPFGSSVGDRLIAELSSGRWQSFRCAVAFAKISGVKYLDDPLRTFVAGGGTADLSVGIDSGGTSFEAASQLAGAVGGGGRLIVTTEIGAGSPSFHPKLYVFAAGSTKESLVIIGSSNLTEGGLFKNHELSTALTLDPSRSADAGLLAEVTKALDTWQDVSSGLAVEADGPRLLALYGEGRLPRESWIRSHRSAAAPASSRGSGTRGLKRRKASRPSHKPKLGPPLVPTPAAPPPALEPGPAGPPAPPGPGPIHDVFYIDIAATTSTTEIFFAKRALKEDPLFFRHPFTGRTKPKRKTSPPQPQLDPKPIVEIRLIDKAGKPVPKHVYAGHELKMWEYVAGRANQDVRVTIPQALRRSLPKGCILEMRRQPLPAGLDYRLDFLTPGSKVWKKARAKASLPLPGSWRKMGWG